MLARGRSAGPAARGRGAGAGLVGLDLTDDQRSVVRQLQVTARDETSPVQQELRFTRQNLHRALFADDRNNATVADLAATVAALEKQLTDLQVKHATAIADVLTPEQREKMRLRDAAGRPGRGGPRGR